MEKITLNLETSSYKWKPEIKEETLELLKHLDLPNESRNTLVSETVEILSQCGSPFIESNSEIGLVFGYVQSGKTMSFTTLTALAKDNGYQIIIIIAGISVNLIDQSFTRLERDLRIDKRTDMQWLSFPNPKISDTTVKKQIETTLAEWKDSTFPCEERKTILITVMKQKDHLPNLQQLLNCFDLTRVPTLIIDDEGDQQSLNRLEKKNVKTKRDDKSTIHARIVELKNTFPHHTFVQYTATPQAPLFINIMNNLSPNFIQLLTPGPDYTGGQTFFKSKGNLINVIDDLDSTADLTLPPPSLIYALQIFFLGVVKGAKNKDGKKRSMMIHPSQRTYTHGQYKLFVDRIKTNFLDILSLSDTDPDKIDLLKEFKIAYDDLSKTTTDLPSFEDLTQNRLIHYIRSTVIQSLNSKKGNKTTVDWRNSYSFILIGGQAMDRGFTVEGLTVTYMPRSIGVGNADTIQQRARFFGYKKSYLGYCRVYLDKDAESTYSKYIVHEEDMRRRLANHKKTEKPLNEWYRQVFLASDIKLARPNVFSHEFERTIINADWLRTIQPHEVPLLNLENNRNTIKDYLNTNKFDNSEKIPRLETTLAKVYDDLLSNLRFTGASDYNDFEALNYIIEKHLEENPDETCTIFIMSDFDNVRQRTLTSKNKINELFQGYSSQYPGDSKIKGEGITIQIHVLDLLIDKQVKYEKIPAIAISLTSDFEYELISWKY